MLIYYLLVSLGNLVSLRSLGYVAKLLKFPNLPKFSIDTIY